MWFSFGQNVLTSQKQMSVPGRLGDLQLVGSVEGSEALNQVRRLHGTDIKLETAHIAEYIHGTERGTVWVGIAESRDAAAELIMSMIKGIEKGDSVFNDLKRLTIAGHEVFRVDGPGGRHFFYSSQKQGERVVWVTIEADDPLPILKEALNKF